VICVGHRPVGEPSNVIGASSIARDRVRVSAALVIATASVSSSISYVATPGEYKDRPIRVDLVPERAAESQRPDQLRVERAPHGIAVEVSDLVAGARRGGRDDVIDAPTRRARAAIVVGEVDGLGGHAWVVLVRLDQVLRVAVGGDDCRARGASGLRDVTRDPATDLVDPA
jgi:hypothetical protein